MSLRSGKMAYSRVVAFSSVSSAYAPHMIDFCRRIVARFIDSSLWIIYFYWQWDLLHYCWPTVYCSSRFRIGWGTWIFPSQRIFMPIWITVWKRPRRRRWWAECNFSKQAILAADGSKMQQKTGIKPKAVLSKMLERTAKNRVIFGAGAKKRKIQKPAWLLDFSMAESVGFEPTCPCGQPHFECGSLWPLR